CGQSYSYPYTF
nr:immunoglobulin light chain junction region [Mus musculus]